jgi:hypothetical protein
MIKKLLSKKGVILVIIPLFVIFTQAFVRYILNKDFNTVGITFGALGLGQLIPFIYFDHFITNKVLNIAPAYDLNNKKLIITYDLVSNVDSGKIESVKNLFFAAVFVSLGLFLVTVYLGVTNQIGWHLAFGVCNCLISWYLLFFK